MTECPVTRDRLSEALTAVLRRLEGIPRELKDEQREALFAALSKEDVFAILPTGYGKSLIYQILPSLSAEVYPSNPSPLVLVVSPLFQLMQEQVEQLKAYGIKSMWIGQGQDVIDVNMPDLDSSAIVFGGPEAILASSWKSNLQASRVQERLVAVVIDEVHCITEWLVWQLLAYNT